MSFYPPFIAGSQYIKNGLTSTNNSNTLGNIYTTNGNVGIGITNPSTTLDVSGSAQISGTISAGTHVGTLFSTGSLGAAGATIGTVYATTVTSGTAQISGTISAGTHVGNLFSSGSFGAGGATIGTLYATTVTSANAQISGTISAGTHVGTLFSSGSLGASGATIGTLYATTVTSASAQISGTISAGTHVGSLFSSGSLGASGITVGTLYANSITGSNAQLSGNITANNMYVQRIDVNGPGNSGSVWLNGSRFASDGTTSNLLMSGSNTIWFSDTNYNFVVSNALQATSVTTATLYATIITGGNAQISGTISAGTYVGTLFSSGSFGAAGATIGTVYATTVTSGTAQISGTISAGTHVGTLFSSGSLGAAGATIGTVYATTVTSASAQISGTISAGTLVGSLVSAASISVSNITVGNNLIVGGSVISVNVTTLNIINNNVSTGTLNASNSSIGTLSSTLITSSSFGASGATIGTVYATTITSASAQISGTISAGTHVGTLFSSGSFGAAGATIGTVYATSAQISGTISAGTHVGTLFSSGSLGAGGATIGTVYATTITSGTAQISGTISAGTHVGTLFSAGSFGAAGATIGTVYATTITSGTAQISGTISAGTHVGTLFSSGSLGASGATIGNIYNTNISTGTLNVSAGLTTGNINFTGTLYQNGSAYIGSSQWTTTNGNLFYTAGNIGIYNTAPSVALDVSGGAQISGTISAGTLSAGTITSATIVGNNVTMGTAFMSNVSINTSSVSSTAVRIGPNVNGQIVLERSAGVNGALLYNDASNNFTISCVSGTNGDIILRPSTASTTGGSIYIISSKNKQSDSSTYGTLVLSNGGLSIATQSDATSITSGGAATFAGGLAVGKTLYANAINSVGLISGGSVGVGGITVGTLYATSINSTTARITNISTGSRIDMTGGSYFSEGTYLDIYPKGTAFNLHGNLQMDADKKIQFGAGSIIKDDAFGLNIAPYQTLTSFQGNVNVAVNLGVYGTLSKAAGTFDIQHPLTEMSNNGYRLLHSFIEGPRCDLIYRGKVQLVNGSAIVDIDQDCVADSISAMTPGTFESLVANPQYFLQNEQSFDKLLGQINGANLTITCENNNSNITVGWMVIGERKDTYIKNWDKTNSNGYLVTEYQNTSGTMMS